MSAYATFTDEDSDLEFRWHGGEYIDVGYQQVTGEPGINGDDFHAYDVINVWDHAAGEATITLNEFEGTCHEYIAAERSAS